MLEDVAFFADPSCSLEGPVEPGPSLAEWVRGVRSGDLPFPAFSDAALEAELADIGDRDFPTRRLNNAYLAWAYDEVLRRASDRVSVTWHRDLAVGVSAAANANANVRAIELRSGHSLTADLVLHAVGHNGSQPDTDSTSVGEFAARHDLAYVAPAFTADVDFSWVRPGQHLIVRGMGLAAVDLAVLLGEGRGGRFERDASGTLRYQRSGREPVLHFGSRRGVPYRSKVTSTQVSEPVRLEYLNAELRSTIANRPDPLDFEHDIRPLVCAELITGYYRELFTGHPERVRGEWAAFSKELRAILARDRGFASEALLQLINRHVPDADDRFDTASFDRPLRFPGDAPTAPDEDEGIHERVLAHIGQDLRQRTGPGGSATQALFLTMLFSYMFVAEIPADAWNARSRTRALPKQWHTFFSYLASGPPGERLEELLALADAGVVRFLGGDLDVTMDEDLGCFVASGSARTAAGDARSRVVAKVLIDARLPDAQAARSDNPLLRQLIADGIADELEVSDTDHHGSTGQIVVAADGALPGDDRQFALGPFTSAPGAGAFTRPGIDSLPFRVHDRTARAILRAAVAATGALAHAL